MIYRKPTKSGGGTATEEEILSNEEDYRSLFNETPEQYVIRKTIIIEEVK